MDVVNGVDVDADMQKSEEEKVENANAINTENGPAEINANQDDTVLKKIDSNVEESISHLNLDKNTEPGEIEENVEESAQGENDTNSLDKDNDTQNNMDKEDTKKDLGLRNMLEDIEEGELDYEEEGELQDDGAIDDDDDDDDADDLPDLPEYDPITTYDRNAEKNGKKEEEGEDGEIISDGEDEEREEGEILDDDETGQVYICVDPVNDKWKKVSKEEKKRLQELEDGQIDDIDEPSEPPKTTPVSTGRFIPRTLCKYFHNGLCRWGSTCRFLHPGINDKGIPADIQPTWNATAGNYVMHRPPGMYPNAYGKAPAPMECINIPVMPQPVVDMSLVSSHPELVNVLPVNVLNAPVYPGDVPAMSKKESAWERGLRRAKEIKEAASRRREEDEDFEEKRRSLRIAGVDDQDSDHEPPDWGHRDKISKSEYYERKYEKPKERYGDKFSKKYDIEKRRPPPDMGYSTRSADLPPNHPLRREERQRYKIDRREEREERSHREIEEERNKVYEPRPNIEEKPTHVTPKVPSSKSLGATEWHDPWMRSQQTQSANQKADSTKQSGVEAVSDSDSSSSDSDSDSDSSSSDSDSGSGSSSSDDDSKSKEERNKERYRLKMGKRRPEEIMKPKPESSYEEWKRQQALKAQQKLEARAKEDPRKLRELEEKKRLSQAEPMPRSISNVPLTKKPMQGPLKFQVSSSSKVRPPVHKDLPPPPPPSRHVDKFDSPKRIMKADSDNSKSDDSDSNSDSDSGSDSSDSDSDDSDTDSESDSGTKARMQSMAPATANTTTLKPFKTAPPLDTNARKDIKLNLNDKPKIEPPTAAAPPGSKRPARKDELLKELKAVEDAIARKRAKID